VLDSIFIGDAVLVADCNSPGWAKGIVSGHLVSNVPRSENIVPSSIDVSRRPAYDISRKSGRDGVAMLGEWHTGILDSAPLIDFMRFGRIEGEEDNELMALTGDDPDPKAEMQPYNQLRGNSMRAPRLKFPQRDSSVVDPAGKSRNQQKRRCRSPPLSESGNRHSHHWSASQRILGDRHAACSRRA